jgi:hypothetical protein
MLGDIKGARLTSIDAGKNGKLIVGSMGIKDERNANGALSQLELGMQE